MGRDEDKQPRRTRRARNEDLEAAVGPPDTVATTSGRAERVRDEVAGVAMIVAATLGVLALLSFEPEGPNLVGPIGRTVADSLLYLFGLASFLVTAVGLAWGVALLRGRTLLQSPHEVLGYGLLVGCLPTVLHMTVPTLVLSHQPGGLLGTLVGELLVASIGSVGAAVVCLGAMTIGLMLATERSLTDTVVATRDRLRDAYRSRAERGASLHAGATPEAEPAHDADEVDDEQAGPESGTSWWRALLTRAAGLFRRSRPDAAVDEATDDADAGWTVGGRYAIVRDGTGRVTPPAGSAVVADPAWAMELSGLGAGDDAGFELSDEDRPRRTRGAVPAAPEVPIRMPVAPESRAALSDEADDDDEESATGGFSGPVSFGGTGEIEVQVSGPVSASSSRSPAPTEIGPVIVESAAQKQRKRAEDLDRAQQVALPLDGSRGTWALPPLSFLRYEEHRETDVDRTKLRDLAAKLERVLSDFKVGGRVSGICPGPVVTLFEFEPESGTKLSRISGLSDDIAMALRAHKVRIIAPIPGKGCVGIEVPNEERETVYLKEILADEAFTRAKSKLTLALGKDIEGFPVVMDLAKSPHLLIAGTTGSGKSVSVNAMITSILYNASPDEVKLILIDPKQLEFAIYEGAPHLLLPVVTDPAKAATALNWAVQEMERRYKLMAELRVRNLSGYNEKLKRLHEGLPAVEIDDDDDDDDYVPSATEALLTRTDVDGRIAHRHMFHLVVIVDEFADLMMVAGKEVEVAVARLAQKARAAGIHVILATQRPSVDVITGLIKANFPTRISFRLMSGTDSRTVLDTIGAENLLGMGDMLYRPPGSSELRRIHGPYIDESEIEKVVRFVNDQREPEYDESILATAASEDVGGSDEPVDPKYDEAVSVVIEEGYASISMLQRRLQVGYNRSARMVEEMERQGIVGPRKPGGSTRRDVLVGGSPFAMA